MLFSCSLTVRSYGTEDRPVPKPIPPRSEVYEYIIFRGSDIKDLNVSEVPKEEEPPIDPAIVSAVRGIFVYRIILSSSQHHMPAVAPSQNLPPLAPAGVRSMQQSASLPNQSQPPLPTHPAPPGGFSPFGPMGGYNPFGVPYFRPVMMGQGLPHMSSHVSLIYAVFTLVLFASIGSSWCSSSFRATIASAAYA